MEKQFDRAMLTADCVCQVFLLDRLPYCLRLFVSAVSELVRGGDQFYGCRCSATDVSITRRTLIYKLQ